VSPNGTSAQTPSGDEDDLVIEVPATPSTPDAQPNTEPGVKPADGSGAASRADLDAEVAALRAKIAALESAIAQQITNLEGRVQDTASLSARPEATRDAESYRAVLEPPPDASITTANPGIFLGGSADRKWGVRLFGYIQAQYQRSELSQDQLQQGGTPLNQDRILVRRGRLRVVGEWPWAGFQFELDGSNTRGPYFGVRRAEAVLVFRNEDAPQVPFARLTVGLTDIPFGFELLQGQDELFFMERSTGGLALFAGPPDLGARLTGGYGVFRYALAVMAGTPLDDRSGQTATDPTSDPDYIGRIGVESKPLDWLEVGGGVSFLYGTGFSPGTDTTKNHLVWRDYNENSTLDTGETTGVPGSGARPSETFDRWGMALDLELGFRTPLGWTRLFGEAMVASNLDRSLFVSDPIIASRDLRQVIGIAAIVAELTPYAFVGFRYDYYNPDSDFLDDRRGVRSVLDYSIHTFSPLIGASWPGLGRLSLQYNVVRDKLGRDNRGVPTDLANDSLTLRLQVGF
jgi:hypothetical protein